jgi:transposase
MSNGTAPLPASSGRTNRHRLNRGGNRQLNQILHYVAVTQISRDPEGRAYYQRKLAEGRTKSDALRCLKRRISDRVYQILANPLPVVDIGARMAGQPPLPVGVLLGPGAGRGAEHHPGSPDHQEVPQLTAP